MISANGSVSDGMVTARSRVTVAMPWSWSNIASLAVDEPLESVVERTLTDPVEGPERQAPLQFAIDRGDHQVGEVVEVPEDRTM